MLCEPIPYGRYIILYIFRVSMFQDSQQRCSPGCYSEQKILPAGIVFTNTQIFKQIIAFILFLWWLLLSWCPKGWLKSIEFLLQFMMITPFLMSWKMIRNPLKSFYLQFLKKIKFSQKSVSLYIYIYLFFSPKGFFC